MGKFKGAEEAAKKLQENEIIEEMNKMSDKLAEQKIVDDLTEAAEKGTKLEIISISNNISAHDVCVNKLGKVVHVAFNWLHFGAFGVPYWVL